MPEIAQRQSPTYNRMPSKLFLWTSDKFYRPPWPWIPTVEIFLEQLSRVVTVEVQKFGSNNVDLKSTAEMSHCVFKASPATFSRVDVTIGRRRKDSVRFKIIFPLQTLRPCARVCLFVTNSFVTRFGKKRIQNKNRRSLQPNW